MEPINSDKLINFTYYSIILSGLFIIIYMMYVDYISEKMSNNNIKNNNNNDNNNKNNNIIKTDNILRSNQILNNVSNPVLNDESTQIKEQFNSVDPSLNYIIKRNYSNIEHASCIKSDITSEDYNKCYMKASLFYPLETVEKTYTISTLPYTIFDPVTNKDTYYANITNISNPLKYNGLGQYRDTNFIISNEEVNRNLSKDGELETIIIDYIKRYLTYYNKINSESPINIILDDNYIANLRNIILLQSSRFFNNTLRSYTITDIYSGIQRLINNFEKFYNDPEFTNTDLSITNNTKLVVLIIPNTYSNNIKTNIVYSLILKIYVSIKITNLTPLDSSNNSSNINSFDTLINNFHHFIYDKDKSYLYTEEKEILFPIMLNFDLPKRIDINTVNLDDDTWINNIILYMNTLLIDHQLLIRNKIKISNNENPIDLIINKLKKIKVEPGLINNISNIFVIYVPKNNIFDDFNGTFDLKIEIDNLSDNKELISIAHFNNKYNPVFCSNINTSIYNFKCLPKCPPNYNIDLGLVCLKSDISNYTPDSDLCKSIESFPDIIKNNVEPGSILDGVIQACNSEYYNNSLVTETPIDIINLSSNAKDGFNQDDDDDENEKEEEFSNNNVKQHFNNIENFEIDTSKLPNINNNKFINELNNRSIYVSRKDNKRYSIDSRPVTQPIIQNNKEVIHFYPFEN